MDSLRKAFEELLTASRKGADELIGAVKMATNTPSHLKTTWSAHTEFVKAIEKAVQALKEYDASA